MAGDAAAAILLLRAGPAAWRVQHSSNLSAEQAGAPVTAGRHVGLQD